MVATQERSAGERGMMASKNLKMFEKFQKVLAGLQGEAILTPPGNISAGVKELLAKQHWQRIAVYTPNMPSMQDVVKSVGETSGKDVVILPGQTPAGFDTPVLRKQLAETDVAISTVDYLVVQTGTAVFINNRQPSRLLTLLPPTVVLIARLEHLVRDLWELSDRVEQDTGETAPALTYFTGPSLTADIEKTLVLGVHGPHRLIILVTDEEG